MTTTLEIIDTAVKVGLGAIISGITTYFMTRRTHSHEIRKSLINEKKEIIKECVIKLEKSSSLLNHVLSSYFNLTKNETHDTDKKLIEIQKDMLTVFNEAKETRAFCYMIRQNNLGELIINYLNKINDLKHQIYSNPPSYNRDEITAISTDINEIKTSILSHLGEAFESIHQ